MCMPVHLVFLHVHPLHAVCREYRNHLFVLVIPVQPSTVPRSLYCTQQENGTVYNMHTAHYYLCMLRLTFVEYIMHSIMDAWRRLMYTYPDPDLNMYERRHSLIVYVFCLVCCTAFQWCKSGISLLIYGCAVLKHVQTVSHSPPSFISLLLVDVVNSKCLIVYLSSTCTNPKIKCLGILSCLLVWQSRFHQLQKIHALISTNPPIFQPTRV